MLDVGILYFIGLCSALIGVFGGTFATLKYDKLLPFLVGAIIGLTLLGITIMMGDIESDKITKQNEIIMNEKLTDFAKLNCNDKADWILKNYLDGNRTITEKAIPIFTNDDCKFDVAQKIIMEPTQ